MIKILCKRITTKLNPETIFNAVFGHSHNRVWLDSSSHTVEHTQDERRRYSIMADDSGIDSYIHNFTHEQEIFNYLNNTVPARFEFQAAKGYECSFQLGWIGWVDYEAKARLLHTDRALVIDHETKDCFVLFFNTQDNTKWFMHLAQKISFAQETPNSEINYEAPIFSSRDSKTSYMLKVEKIKEEIHEGNTYEGCLTTELSTPIPENFNALETYLCLRQNNKAPYSAFLELENTSVMSTSPERFLGVSATGKIIAEPIKGTRKRLEDPIKDRDVVEELYSSIKDRAENMMIVDLMRNDLSHYAIPGTVKVERLFAIESYQTVHQMVSTISAQLKEEAPLGSVLQEAFPPGSMTGAPKIETIKILERLEQNPRGIYSGCLGFISYTGACELSVIIRTLIAHDGTLTLSVGGAVVTDSSPEEEYEEIRTKANGILKVLGSDFPG